ncbi:MAG TPA: hypothetical protein VK837_01790 [Longimicrobiales bacterium]|nr:hypothetical protein [Longimicrobiales bacterium]
MNRLLIASIALSTALFAAGCMDGEADADADAMAETAEDQSINGTWRLDPSSASWENDSDRLLLQDGSYTCESCTPPYSVVADGQWHEVDQPTSDSEMVEVVDERTVRFASRLNGKDMGNSTATVSEDGETMVMEFTALGGDVPVTGTVTFNRVGPALEGAHAMSGEWEVADIRDITEEGLTVTINVEGDQYTSSGNGQSFTATLGGEPVAIEGDETGGMVAVERLADNRYRETYSRDGETTGVLELTVGEDGTLSGVATDPRDDSVVRWTATRN